MPSREIIQLAYSDLVSEVFLHLRNGSFNEGSQLHDLGDALHNVSGILGSYGTWIDDENYRELYLRPYDKRWGSKGLVLEDFLIERIAVHTKA